MLHLIFCFYNHCISVKNWGEKIPSILEVKNWGEKIPSILKDWWFFSELRGKNPLNSELSEFRRKNPLNSEILTAPENFFLIFKSSELRGKKTLNSERLMICFRIEGKKTPQFSEFRIEGKKSPQFWKKTTIFQNWGDFFPSIPFFYWFKTVNISRYNTHVDLLRNIFKN